MRETCVDASVRIGHSTEPRLLVVGVISFIERAIQERISSKIVSLAVVEGAPKIVAIGIRCKARPYWFIILDFPTPFKFL